MKLSITQDHIAESIRLSQGKCNGEVCPISLALKSLGYKNATTLPYLCRADNIFFKTSEGAYDFIENFDAFLMGKSFAPPNPTEVELEEIPLEVAKLNECYSDVEQTKYEVEEFEAYD